MASRRRARLGLVAHGASGLAILGLAVLPWLEPDTAVLIASAACLLMAAAVAHHVVDRIAVVDPDVGIDDPPGFVTGACILVSAIACHAWWGSAMGWIVAVPMAIMSVGGMGSCVFAMGAWRTSAVDRLLDEAHAWDVASVTDTPRLRSEIRDMLRGVADPGSRDDMLELDGSLDGDERTAWDSIVLSVVHDLAADPTWDPTGITSGLHERLWLRAYAITAAVRSGLGKTPDTLIIA